MSHTWDDAEKAFPGCSTAWDVYWSDTERYIHRKLSWVKYQIPPNVALLPSRNGKILWAIGGMVVSNFTKGIYVYGYANNCWSHRHLWTGLLTEQQPSYRAVANLPAPFNIAIIGLHKDDKPWR